MVQVSSVCQYDRSLFVRECLEQMSVEKAYGRGCWKVARLIMAPTSEV